MVGSSPAVYECSAMRIQYVVFWIFHRNQFAPKISSLIRVMRTPRGIIVTLDIFLNTSLRRLTVSLWFSPLRLISFLETTCNFISGLNASSPVANSSKDFEYAWKFLFSYDGSAATFSSYRRDVECLLLW